MKHFVWVLIGVVGLLLTSGYPSSAADKWDDVLANAKKEGKVVLGTNLGMPKFRQNVAKAFQDKYGIEVEIRAMRGAELTAVAKRECAAHAPSMDVLLSGNSEEAA